VQWKSIVMGVCNEIRNYHSLQPDLHLAASRIKCMFYGYLMISDHTSVYNGIMICCEKFKIVMNHIYELELIIPGKSYNTGFIIMRILCTALQT
jgi:hypothetical protein